MKKLKLFFLCLLWIFILTELVIRTAYKEKYVTRQLESNWINDSTIGFLPTPNTKFKLISSNVNREIKVNSFGFYGDDFNISRSLGFYRMAFVGSSSEIGQLNEENISYIDLCNEMFKKEKGKIEFMNFSIPNNNRDYSKIVLIKTRILKFNPKVIFLKVSLPLIQQNIAKEDYKGIIIDYELNSISASLYQLFYYGFTYY